MEVATFRCMTDPVKKIEDIEGGHLGYEKGDISMLANNHIAVSHGINTSIWDGKNFHDFTGSLLAVTGGSAIVVQHYRNA